MKRISIVMFLLLTLMVPAAVLADNLARDYIPAPPGTLAIFAYYEHLTASDLYVNGNKFSNNIDLNGNIGLFRPVYFTQIGPFVIDPQFIIPFGSLSLDLNNGISSSNSSGFGDPILLATIWFLNDTKSKTYLGFTPFFYIPVGSYDNGKAVNLSENRWHFREELGFVKGWEILPEHNLYFELQLAGDFFTNNNDVVVNPVSGATGSMSQSPGLTVESHLSYDVTKLFWASADYYYHYNGKQVVNDVTDPLSGGPSSTVGMTLGYNIAPSFQLVFQYKADAYVQNGAQTQTALLRFLYATDFLSLTKGK
jgi:hypothetical protein